MDIERGDTVEWTYDDGSTLKGVVTDIFITTNIDNIQIPMMRIKVDSGLIYSIYADHDSLQKKNLVVKFVA